jgi:vancomycin aglycone glucosyltransferase
MRIALSTCEDVEPMAGLAMHSRSAGAEVRVCAPPDVAELLSLVGVTIGVWR